MEYEIIWTNGFISLGWYDIRLDLVDSDGMQIDYIFDCCFYDENEQNEIIQNVKNAFNGCDESTTCQIINEMFDSIAQIISLDNNTTLSSLYDRYGKDWVCRVGNTAIIIKD